MKQCRECGTLSPADTVFCYICGTRFPDDQSEELSGTGEIIEESELSRSNDSVSFSCPACGSIIRGNRRALIDNGYVVCENCAKRIEIGSSEK